MTRIILPLDVAINKPFKEYMRRKYIDYSALKNLDNAKISNNTLLNWITEIWWEDKLVIFQWSNIALEIQVFLINFINQRILYSKALTN